MRYDLLIRPQYALFLGRRMPVAIGRGGIGVKRGEGDNITPAGTWYVEEWRARPARINLDVEPIGPQDKWGDGDDAQTYNQLFRHDSASSYERLYRADPLYDIIGVINYNRAPIELGKGSAIFIHKWRKPRHPTEGCIAFSHENLLWIAQNWTAETRVIIQP